MAKLHSHIKFTYEDYQSLPESETKRYELLGGELVMVPSPSWKHQRISGELEFCLKAFVKEHQLGIVAYAPLDVVFGQGDAREVAQPDILFISNERASIIHAQEIRGAPDLLVEILSPSTEARDRHYKQTLYARYGVREYWLVDPKLETVEVLTLQGNGFERISVYGREDTLQSPLLPDLQIPLDKVF